MFLCCPRKSPLTSSFQNPSCKFLYIFFTNNLYQCFLFNYTYFHFSFLIQIFRSTPTSINIQHQPNKKLTHRQSCKFIPNFFSISFYFIYVLLYLSQIYSTIYLLLNYVQYPHLTTSLFFL